MVWHKDGKKRIGETPEGSRWRRETCTRETDAHAEPIDLCFVVVMLFWTTGMFFEWAQFKQEGKRRISERGRG